MPGTANSDSGFFDSGMMYIFVGVVGIFLIIAIVKFDKIRRLYGILKSKKGRKE